ncbi:MAG: UDP-N-acetylmuramate--L-alanine ligase, partial [Bacteriovoracia bacterium]
MRSPRDTRIHFIGIGGIGMSGIAEMFHNQGCRVTGSDLVESDSTKRLQKLGITVFIGHRRENIDQPQVVVISSAVKATNPEVVRAKELRIPVIPRAEMLGELMRGRTGIAVAGTHGKTSTTSMLATVLMHAQLDPTLVIGGVVNSLGGNAKLGQGEYLVAEADESDGSFLHLPATYAVVTNIDNDHLDHYGSLEQIDHAFVEFVGKLPFYGLAAVCLDDPGVRRCLSRWTKPVRTYGFSEQAEFFAREVKLKPLGSVFNVYRGGDKLGEVELNVPGKHNILNALATIVISVALDVPFAKIAAGLKEYRGVDRRFEIIWQDEKSRRAIIEDYGHHPSEISATLDAARIFWTGRIIAVFQPHRYSRTLHCKDGFLSAFRQSDVVLVSDIYGAGEDPIEGVTAQGLVEEMKAKALANQTFEYAGDLDRACEMVKTLARPGDLILCMGAGSITKLP